MSRTPDRSAGPREEEEVQFYDRTADGLPLVTGALRYTQQGFTGLDAHASFNFRDSFIRKTMPYDLYVPADLTFLTHDLVIADGVDITVEDTGEMLVL